MKQIVARIPSHLYFSLYERALEVGIDPDRLIATYAIIKTSRQKERYSKYTAKNNKTVSGYALLRAKTSLSLQSLKKYTPLLIEEGVILFDRGDVAVLGNSKLKEKYNSNKLVPIIVGKNLVETTRNSFSIRLHSSKNSQEIMISKKKHRSELILQSNNPYTLKQLKRGQDALKRFGEIEINDNVILSNQGYSDLKGGVSNSKSRGEYWKRKMQDQGLLETKRRFKLIKKMSYLEYKQYKYHNDELSIGKYTYIRGFLAEELCSSMIPMDTINRKVIESKEVVPSSKVKPLSYLSFDFIAWAENEDIKACTCNSRS